MHPAVLITLWACLAIIMQSVPMATLLLAGLPLLAVASLLSRVRLLTLLRRIRWIMLSLLLIYAYATPGAAIWPSLAQFSPTFEGLAGGVLQACRLVFALAGLAILLQVLPPPRLVNGLYVLSYPLRYVGLPRQRIAVRLALTLHYAEASLLHPPVSWHEHMQQMLTPLPIKLHSIEIPLSIFTWLDGLLLVSGCAGLVWVLL